MKPQGFVELTLRITDRLISTIRVEGKDELFSAHFVNVVQKLY